MFFRAFLGTVGDKGGNFLKKSAAATNLFEKSAV
jgi:hypothetical protein